MNHAAKKWLAVFAAAALTAATFAGCTGETTSSSSEVSSSTSTESSQTSSEAASSSGKLVDYSAGLDENGFYTGVKALDYVTLPEGYQNMEIPADVSAVSDEDLQAQIDSFLTSFESTTEVKDRAVEDGDTVNIDYVGTVGGQEFSGGSTNGAGTDVTIGVTQYIDDFLEQLIGHKPGETFDVNVTFPEDYGVDELNGKDAVFKTTINYISEPVDAQWTDDFINENLSETYGWTTVAQAEEEIRKSLQDNSEYEFIIGQLEETAEISEIPAAVNEYFTNYMKNNYIRIANNYGLSLEDYLEQYESAATFEEVVETRKDSLEESARHGLLIQALAEDMNLNVTDEDVAAYFKENMGTEDYSNYESAFGMPYLKMSVYEVKARDALLETVVRAQA